MKMLLKGDSLFSNSDESDDEKMTHNKRKRESESSSSEDGSDEDEVYEDSDNDSENVSDSDCNMDSQEESDSDESNISTSSKFKPGNSADEETDSDTCTRKYESREVCAICLNYMNGDIGSPELCDHSFCLECILEWAKTNNSCPQDRTQFLQVFVRKIVKGKIVRTITVEEVKPENIPEDDDDEEPTFCEVCGRCDREDTLLLCDGCDSGHHLECLSPPLSSVPIEEWYCNECQSLDRMRISHEDVIDLAEVTSLIDEAGNENRLNQGRSCRFSTITRRLPRTRASERIRRRIRRVRSSRGENFQELPFSENGEDVINELDDTEVQVSTTTHKGVEHHKKKRKVTIKRKRKTKRKTTKHKKKTCIKKNSTKTKRKSGKKRKLIGSKKNTKKRKTTTKKRSGKWMKKKGKKKPNPQAIITPKARLAEALGIRPMKNPWQLSLPAMTGGRSQEGASLTNQRWRAGVPSLSLLGSNSELDYISEPDEFGDAILVAGVARRHQNSEVAIARRKSLTVEMLSRSNISSMRNISSLPVSDSNVSSVSDLLDNIIQSQSMLHMNANKLNKIEQCKDKNLNSKWHKGLGKQMGTGPDSPTREGNQTRSPPPRDQSNRNGQPPRFIYGVYSTSKGSDNILSNVPFSSNGDPTGSIAYSSYLREQSHSDDASIPESSSNQGRKKAKKEDKKKRAEDDDVNLYSDIEPEIPEENDDSEVEDEEENKVNQNLQEQHEENDSPLSEDELVIDDSIKQDSKRKRVLSKTLSGGTNSENEVGSSNLPGLNDFELEAVSDADTHEMDKSMNSSISLSDSNMGDAEVTSSTNEINLGERDLKDSSSRIVHMYNRSTPQGMYISSVEPPMRMGLEGLETETISDNEEMCFEDNYGNEDDNIEEGEIPNENIPRALPANRPKINIHLRRVIEVSSPNKEFEGECEEGEIIDESAAKKEKKREKAKREVDEVVNQQLDDDPKVIGDKENVNPDPNTSQILSSELEVSSPVKLLSPIDKNAKIKDKKEKQTDKEKEKEKEKEKAKVKDKPRDKDIAFKKVSRNTKIRNYRDNDKDLRNKRKGSMERSYSRERGHSREKGYSRERGQSKERGRMREKKREGGYSNERYRRRERDCKKEPKRKEMERYNVRQMINKKEEERKKKDEFGRDVSLREVHPSRSRTRSRSRSKGRGRRRSESNTKKRMMSGRNKGERLRKSFSRSRSKSHKVTRSKRRRSYSTSSSSSSSTTSTSSSSSYSSSSSSSRSCSRSRRTREHKRLSKSRSKSLTKKVEKKKIIPKTKEKIKKIVSTSQKKKTEEKKKEKKKEEEEPKVEKQKKKKKRDKTPLQSKEVYQAGGSIMVSVNFSRNTAKENKDPKKKKDKDVRVDDLKKKKKMEKNASSPFHEWSPRVHSLSPVGKHTPLQDEPMWSPENLHHKVRSSEAIKSPEVIDLDIIMVTPPLQEPILISDSEEEEEEEGITRLPPDLGVQQRPTVPRNQGPKTPPEPGVKFTLSTKQVLKPITNPLRDEEEEECSIPVPSRGPNTPPGPPPESDESIGRPKSPLRRIPRSPVGTPPVSSPEPDVYDPFEPTKSPSPPTRSPQQEARVSSSDQIDQNIVKSPTTRAPSKGAPSPPPPPLPTDPPQKDERPPEPQKAPEDEATSTAALQTTSLTIPTSAAPPCTVPPHSVAPLPGQIVTSLPGVISLSSVHTLPSITTTNTQPLNPMQQIFAGLPANVANILYPAALAAAAMRGATNSLLRPPGNALVPPDFSRPPPATPGILSRPPPISPLKTDRGKVNQNGQNLTDVVDMDLGSPTSPDSSDVSDMFEPPSPHTTLVQDKTSPRKIARPAIQKSPLKPVKHLDKFDVLFGSGKEPRLSKASHKSKSNAKKLNKNKPYGKKLGENEEDIPSSAVDLQVKEKLLKKVQRQERVVDEVKLCLKPFYNKKTINKDDYKDIMKKCVQKVCHNKTGEINPNKIRSLVEGYIKKVKYYRKKQGVGGTAGLLNQIKSGPILPPTVNDPPPPGFGLKTHIKLKQ